MKKLILGMLLAQNICAQTDSTILLPSLNVSINRLYSSALGQVNPLTTQSISSIKLKKGTQQLSVNEVLGSVSGVFGLNQDNYAQDLRISIRGFGARAAFGIRGIRFLVDEIPEGSPDGQVDVDNLDMASLEQIEVLKTAASGLFGNASGGVVAAYMPDPSVGTQSNIQMHGGSFGYNKLALQHQQKLKTGGIYVAFAHNNLNGFRDWSAAQSNIANLKVVNNISKKLKTTLLANYGFSPYAQDPGGIDEKTLLEQPKAAFLNNKTYLVSESVEQFKLAAKADYKIKGTAFVKFKTYGIKRELNNRLAIFANGLGELRRSVFGQEISLENTTSKFSYHVGLQHHNQTDHRSRFSYLKIGTDPNARYEKNALVLAQNEGFENFAATAQMQYALKSFIFYSALRQDFMHIRLDDNYLKDGLQTGDKKLKATNPYLSLSKSFDLKTLKNSLFASFGSAFEAPTLNELSNNPLLMAGFNEGLLPQSSKTAELGLKGKNARLRYEIALFNIITKNDILSYQIAGQGTRNFYKNAGSTQRKGIETLVDYQLNSWFSASFSQTLGSYVFKDYVLNNVDYKNKMLPGIPARFGQIEARAQSKTGFFVNLALKTNSRIAVNDANSVYAKSVRVLNLKIAQEYQVNHTTLEPVAGINNLLDQKYAGNILINAANNRYFESAQPRNYYFGLKVQFK